MNYKTEIAEFSAEFINSFLYAFKDTEFFTYDSMLESLYKEIDLQLKSMKESTLINLVKSYSFDDAFQLRYFSSLIVQESNPDDYKLANRPDLKSGLDKLLEADRIKKSLIQYEQDMWQH